MENWQQKYASKEGSFTMHLHSKVAKRTEYENGIFPEDAASEGVHIEEILDRAHQIHRDRGGLIGYDLEDWLQAERDLIGELSHASNELKERNSKPHSLEIHTAGQDDR
jgi:hypothetical protein